MKEDLQFHYNVEIARINRHTGEILDIDRFHNLIVNDGLTKLRDYLAGDTVPSPIAIAIGTGTTAPANGDTELETENTRAIATITKPASYQVRYAKVYTFASAYAITEAGLVNSLTVSGSELFNRFIFSAKNVDTDTNLSVTIDLTVGRV